MGRSERFGVKNCTPMLSLPMHVDQQSHLLGHALLLSDQEIESLRHLSKVRGAS